MRRAIAWGLAACLAATALGQTKKEFEAFLTKTEPLAAKAFSGKDLKWFQSVAAPEFKYTDHTGNSEDLKTSLEGMKQMFAMADKIKVFYKRGAVTFSGGVGTARYANTYHLTLKPGQDGKAHVMTVKSKTKESWKKVGNTWKLVGIVDTEASTLLMDGKPIGGG